MTCPKGFWCDKTNPIIAQKCHAGYYCPESSFEEKVCPPGSSIILLGSIADACFSCPKGSTATGPPTPRQTATVMRASSVAVAR